MFQIIQELMIFINIATFRCSKIFKIIIYLKKKNDRNQILSIFLNSILGFFDSINFLFS